MAGVSRSSAIPIDDASPTTGTAMRVRFVADVDGGRGVRDRRDQQHAEPDEDLRVAPIEGPRFEQQHDARGPERESGHAGGNGQPETGVHEAIEVAAVLEAIGRSVDSNGAVDLAGIR